MKACTRCRLTKPIDEYGIDRSSPDGRSYYCKPCVTTKGREQRARETEEQKEAKRARARAYHRTLDPDFVAARQRNSTLKMRYGITSERYAEVLHEQGGACAICGGEEPKGFGKYLSVDHCHETGQVRSLLCQSCNTSLGHMRDSPQLLREAALYLERWQSSNA